MQAQPYLMGWIITAMSIKAFQLTTVAISKTLQHRSAWDSLANDFSCAWISLFSGTCRSYLLVFKYQISHRLHVTYLIGHYFERCGLKTTCA